ncbi:hypothetical protein HF086_016023 [Spodoptera exigua]|uniref:Uncharacterized protein n=1 Tax=Spodoptera exigua TaxID=7107 RepID=A0A922MNR5_SPOEX|nr:hypothetical protein HF086_016023 [Spodoptera exigua]
MSLTLSIHGTDPTLNVDFLPPIELGEGEYECALIYFKSFNSIPNVDTSNNLFHYGDNVIVVPEGSYELDNIIHYLEQELEKASGDDPNKTIDILANTNTMKCIFYSSYYDIHFERENSIGSVFGFSQKMLPKMQIHQSNQPINILITNTIRVECNIIRGSFINSISSHVLHEFSPSVPPGYQIIECPPNLVYLPLKSNTIQNLQIRVVNEQGNLVNFRKENISIRLHIRKISS